MSASLPAEPVAAPSPTCPRCRKPEPYCVCAGLEPVSTRLTTVILQHPQEQDELLGTGWLCHCQLERSVLRVGLSWPSLKRILEREVDMKRWGVLFLGAATEAPRADEPELLVVDRKGARLPEPAAALRRLEGLVLLDGTWSQAKTLWWRNPWLLKCQRLMLNPRSRSGYGRLRREPRREGLATLEAAALALARIEQTPDLEPRILRPFTLLVETLGAAATAGEAAAGSQEQRGGARRRRGQKGDHPRDRDRQV